MKKLIILLCFIPIACCPTKSLTTIKQDSTNVEVRYRYIERLRDTMIYVDIPVEIKHDIATDESILETTVAWSTAKIDSTGLLFHELHNKPIQISRPIQYIEVETIRDSIIHDISVKYVEKVQIKKYIPKFMWIISIFAIIIVAIWAISALKRITKFI